MNCDLDKRLRQGTYSFGLVPWLARLFAFFDIAGLLAEFDQRLTNFVEDDRTGIATNCVRFEIMNGKAVGKTYVEVADPRLTFQDVYKRQVMTQL